MPKLKRKFGYKIKLWNMGRIESEEASPRSLV